MEREDIELKKSIAEAYNNICNEYDETRFGEKVNYERLRIDEIAKETLSTFLKPGTVLEVGVGTGRYTIPLSKSGRSCYGVDISTGMLQITKQKCQKEKIQSGLFLMDGENLGFQYSSFDNVICLVTFGFIKNYKKALEEFCRVLKPHGRLIIIYHNGDNWGNKLKMKAFCLSIDTPYIKYRKFANLNNVLKNEGLRVVFQKDILNFPTFVYHILPKKVLNLNIIKRFDSRLKHGWMSVLVADKTGNKH